MPKIKTNKSAAKRFRTTATGKVMRSKSGMRHLLTNKSAGNKRRLGKSVTISKSDTDRVKKLLPYT